MQDRIDVLLFDMFVLPIYSGDHSHSVCTSQPLNQALRGTQNELITLERWSICCKRLRLSVAKAWGKSTFIFFLSSARQ
jgi:hypothetical protein